jgi:Ca-activated chloride channel family protein
MMHLAYPANLWWLWLAVLVPALGVLALVRRRLALRRLQLAGERVRFVGLIRFAARTAALILLALAMLGPCWGTEEVPVPPARGRDLMIVLDVSRSMLAEDALPNRLEYARRQVQRLGQLLEKHGGYRVGLIAFADRPALLCPLTNDFRHFQEELRNANLLSVRLRADGVPAGSGTELGQALERALAMLPTEPDGRSNSDVLVVTDGGDEGIPDRDRTVAIHALGVGDPTTGSPIPLKGQAGQRQVLVHDGQAVQTRLAEAELKRLAEQTGGLYLNAGQHDDSAKRLLSALDAKDQRLLDQAGQATIPIHRFAWFLLPAIALLLVENLIPVARPIQMNAQRTHWLRRLVPPPVQRTPGPSPIASRS